MSESSASEHNTSQPITCPHCKEIFGARRLTKADFEKVIDAWQLHWMNQTINEEDTKNYRRRAMSVDANMRYGLARMLAEAFGQECAEGTEAGK